MFRVGKGCVCTSMARESPCPAFPRVSPILFTRSTEGCELTVLKSSLKLISQGKVHQIVMENCPYLWGRCSTTASDAERVFGQLLHQGYFLYIYDGDAQNEEFFTKTKGFKLPQVQMPNDDYQLFVLPTKVFLASSLPCALAHSIPP